MNRILRTLSTFLVLPLLATVCNAQSNESDRELILKINGSAYRSSTYGVDARARVDSLSFLRVNGEFNSLLAFRRLWTIRLLEMKSGWLERIVKRYPDLHRLDFDASLLKVDELESLGELTVGLRLGYSF